MYDSSFPKETSSNDINLNIENKMLKDKVAQLNQQVSELSTLLKSRDSRPRLRTKAFKNNLEENKSGVSAEAYQTLLDKLEDKDNQIKRLELKLSDLNMENEQLSEMIKDYSNSKKHEKAATILEKAIKYNKTPSEIIKETGFCKTTVYDVLSINNARDKKRIKMICKLFKEKFTGVSVDDWFDEQFIKKHNLLSYDEVMKQTGLTYYPDDKEYERYGYIYVDYLKKPVFKYKGGSVK